MKFFSIMFIPVRLFGLTSSFINILVFSHKDFKEKIFNYLFIHSISEFVYYFVTSFLIFSYCQVCPESATNSYFVEFIIIYLDRFLSSAIVIFSLFIEITIAIHRYIVVFNCKPKTKDNSYVVSSILAIISLGIFIPELLTYKIVASKHNVITINDNNSNITINFYDRDLTEFGKNNKQLYAHYRILVNILRGPICLLILTVFGVLTLFQFRKQMKIKKIMKRIPSGK
jgi:hypothetical protein